jgi:hypothetical protein
MSTSYSKGGVSSVFMWLTDLTRRAVCVRHNIEACSCNHCCSGKAIIITYYEWVYVAVVTQHAVRVHYIVTCDLPGCTVFCTLSHKRQDSRK